MMGPVTIDDEVTPAWPVRLPRLGWDRLARRRDGRVERLVHLDGHPVLLRVWLAGRRVRLRAESPEAAAGEAGMARARFWSGVDDDLRPFAERFGADAVIGASIREAPDLRPDRRPLPFEALAWAVCEQLITGERATAIQRRLIARHGRRDPVTGMRDAPAPAVVARLAPAELRACDLSAGRALALIRASREVASGRVDLLDPDRRAAGHARLRAIPGIGPWTVACLALHGQGDPDALPAGDLAYRVLVGQVRSGRPRSATASEAEVEEFFLPYAGWRGLAGQHMLRMGGPAVRRALLGAAA
jgi:3-methyladenine DNA glycosylase/8-oxoguanine DNA glycosylase